MLEEITTATQAHMEKAIKVLKDELSKVRTGRASPALVETLRVDYYGTLTPLNQMASINAPEPRLLVIQPWDQNALDAIEKALQKIELGAVPKNDGKMIRLAIPPLTEERRKEFVKLANKLAEDSRVAIRNIRRSAIEDMKKMGKEKKVSEDDQKRTQTKLQEITDTFIKKIDEIADKKAKEILQI